MAITINASNLTNATTVEDGTGIFDNLMKTINIHLEHQYTKGRIKGPDYANVYIQSIQAALSQSTQLALSEKQLEIDLLKTNLASWTTLYTNSKVVDEPALIKAEALQALYDEINPEPVA